MLPLINSSYFHDFVEGITSGVLVMNTRGDVYVANQAAARIIGRPRDLLVGAAWGELFSGVAEQEELERFIAEAHRTDRCRLPLTIRLARGDGRILHLSISASLLVEYNKIFGIFLLLTDITGIVHLHERERRILEENAAMQRERVESLTLLANSVAHQIRNPLMTIGGFAARLKREVAPGSAGATSVDIILEAGARLEGVVKAVEEYAAISVTNPVPEDVEGLVREAWARSLEAVAKRLPKRVPEGVAAPTAGLVLELEPARVLVERVLGVRLLREVLQNALEAVPRPGGVVTVRGRPVERGMYGLAIEDNGPGISPEVLPYVLDPFFTTNPRGVGMGLTMASRAAREHGGRLTVESPAGGGVRVLVELPVNSTAGPTAGAPGAVSLAGPE